MKKNDLIVVGIIVFIAAIFSYVISNALITPSDNKIEAEEVSAITPTFTLPDDKVLNTNAINPTVKIQIQPVNNKQPFANEDQ